MNALADSSSSSSMRHPFSLTYSVTSPRWDASASQVWKSTQSEEGTGEDAPASGKLPSPAFLYASIFAKISSTDFFPKFFPAESVSSVYPSRSPTLCTPMRCSAFRERADSPSSSMDICSIFMAEPLILSGASGSSSRFSPARPAQPLSSPFPRNPSFQTGGNPLPSSEQCSLSHFPPACS